MLAWLVQWVAIVGLAVIFFAMDLPRMALVGDTTVQGALDRAAVAGSQQYIPGSFAGAGGPQIDTARAVQAVNKRLAEDLQLDPLTLAPLVGSPLAEIPNVTVYVYNGPTFPHTYRGPPGVEVTLTYPGVVVAMDATLRNTAPMSPDQKTVVLHRYSAGMWVPRQRPQN